MGSTTDDLTRAAATVRGAKAKPYNTMMKEVEPLIFQRVCAELGFDPNAVVRIPSPTAEEVKRGNRVTKKVMGRLNRRQVPPPAEDTIAIMDDATITPVSAPPVVTDPATAVSDEALDALRRRNGLG